ncbi:MAG: hypothetical protein WBA96_09410 [Chitinophagaceae bacterium]|nr:hypothetical protein [Chitinophagaceae bacterium]
MKTRIPLEILDILKPTNNNKLSLTSAKETDGILFLVPVNPSLTDFYFRIVKKNGDQVSGEKTKYLIQYKPIDRTDISTTNRIADTEMIEKFLADWLNILIEYSNIETIFDDPILKKYQEDFEEKLKIIDDDAEFAPFNLEKQIFLIDYLDFIIQKANDEKTEENKSDIELIIKESNELKAEITQTTKSKAIKKLSKILGRVQKSGIKFIKEVFIKVAADITAKLLLGNINH